MAMCSYTARYRIYSRPIDLPGVLEFGAYRRGIITIDAGEHITALTLRAAVVQAIVATEECEPACVYLVEVVNYAGSVD